MDHPVRYAAERLAWRALFVALAGVFVVLVVPMAWHTLSPFLIAIPVAAALQPPIRFCTDKLRLRRGIAVAFWVLLVTAIALLIVYWFISFVVGQVVGAANNVQGIVASITGVLRTASDRLLDAAESMPATVRTAITDALNSAFRWLSEQATVLATGLLNMVVNLASGVPYALIYANFLILAVFFITGRYPQIKQGFVRRRDSQTGTGFSTLRRSAGKGTMGYLRVQLLWFIVLLALSTVFFQVLGFQYAVLIALLAALLEMIPQFGCGVLYIPWAVICFVIGDSRSGWLVLGFYIAYSMLRRVLDPKLLGDNLGMSPLLSLVGMFVGMRLGGVLGLILGPIAMVVLVSAVRSHLFDGVNADLHTLVSYMKLRWQRGRDEESRHAAK